jgi:ferredoxin
MTVHIVVDEELCQGHARCNMTAPQLMGLRDEDGHAVVLVDPVPAQWEEAARRVALGCPERAIRLVGPEEA